MADARKGLFIRLTDELKKHLFKASKELGVSAAAFIRLAIIEKLSRHERKRHK